MDVWLDYSLSDFLLFSPETYWRLFEQMNEAVWPYQIVLLAAFAAVAVSCVFGWQRAGLATGTLLALSWVVTGLIFFEGFYAPVNWAISWFVPLIWVQAALLLLLAPRLDYATPSRINGLALVVVVLALAYPLIGVVSGRPIGQGEVAGIAPDPTAFLTLGLIGLAQPGWHRIVLSVLPGLWLIFSAATLYALDSRSLSVFVILGISFVALLSATRIGNHFGFSKSADAANASNQKLEL